jgi:hypothetical protein
LQPKASSEAERRRRGRIKEGGKLFASGFAGVFFLRGIVALVLASLQAHFVFLVARQDNPALHEFIGV